MIQNQTQSQPIGVRLLESPQYEFGATPCNRFELDDAMNLMGRVFSEYQVSATFLVFVGSPEETFRFKGLIAVERYIIRRYLELVEPVCGGSEAAA